MIGIRRPNFSFVATAVALLLTCVVGCKRDAAAPADGQPADAGVTLTLNGHPLKLEVAATELSRNLGLMYRDSMPADAGMIFVFRDEEPRNFWMHNTHIPLDIVYLDSHCRIVSIKQMKPMDDSAVPSEGPAKMAIELNVGTAAKIGLKPGDVVSIPAYVQNPANLE